MHQILKIKDANDKYDVMPDSAYAEAELEAARDTSRVLTVRDPPSSLFALLSFCLLEWAISWVCF